MQEAEKSADKTAINFRAPNDLAEWLKKEAAENQRSVSNQTVWSLQQFRRLQEAKNAHT